MAIKEAGDFQEKLWYSDLSEQCVKSYIYLNGKRYRRKLFSFQDLGLDENGKAIKKGTREAKRLDRLCYQKREEIIENLKKELEIKPGGHQIGQIFKKWIETNSKNKDIRLGTIGIHQIMVDQYLEIVGNHPLPVQPHHIDRFKAGLSSRMKPVTQNIRLKALTTFLNWAKKRKYIQSEIPEIEKAQEEKKIPGVLTSDEINLILNRIAGLIEKTDDSRHKRLYKCHELFLMLCMGLGLRRSEAFYLEWQDFDWKENTVWIHSKPPGFKIKEKNEKVVPLPDYLADYLQTIEKTTNWLFPRDLYSDPGAITKAFRRHLNALELNKRKIKACHNFRAGYITFLYNQGVDIESIRALAGHQSTDTTRIYIEDEKERKRQAVKKLQAPDFIK